MRFRQTSNLVAAAIGLLGSATAFENDAYDYIVVGGGPSGIIAAERFVEAGHKVLLLERGPGSTVPTGANDTLRWDHDLTPIDVPGLSGDIATYDVWNEYLCTDTAGFAACALGGGVSVNYMVFVHPPDHDFNDKWPQGWKWEDVAPAAERLYQRNPGSTLPSADGKYYDQGLYTIFSNFLDNLGWRSVDMIDQPNEKHQVYSHPSWNIKDQMRAGPVRTYLPDIQHNDRFTLSLGTKVVRLVRSGSQVTGVEVETASGQTEVIALTCNGRVVLASGALSTPRVLFNSGIGPKAQIETAQKTGVAVPTQEEWIDLPVGVGLKDHSIFSLVVKTNGTFGSLDSASVLNGNDTTNISQYKQHNGVLTQGKHRLIFFTSNEVDGETRYYQGSCAPGDDSTISLSAYMTHGLTSSGVLGLDKKGNTVIEKSPYLQTAGDRKAARVFLQQLVDDITAPSTGFQLDSYTNVSAVIDAQSPGGHYTGTARMGTDDGRDGGSAVVDTNAKVYGMDNLVGSSNVLILCFDTNVNYSTLSMLVFTRTFPRVIPWPLPWLSLKQRLPEYLLRTKGFS